MSITGLASNSGLSTISSPAQSSTAAATASQATAATAAATNPGSADPFQQLSSDLQAWLTQLQAGGNSAQAPGASASDPAAATAGTTAAQPKAHHHHHHHAPAGDATQSNAQGSTSAQSIGARLTQDLAQMFKSYSAGSSTPAAASITA